MRIFLALWIIPIVLLGIWYGLSANDLNFGMLIFSRQMHDLVFQIYANMLGVSPQELPSMVVKALVFDSFLIGLIIAFRKRATLIPWIKAQFGYGQDAVNKPESELGAALTLAKVDQDIPAG